MKPATGEEEEDEEKEEEEEDTPTLTKVNLTKCRVG
jgi:hypothetical protein